MKAFVKRYAKAVAAFVVTAVVGVLSRWVNVDPAVQVAATTLLATFFVWLVRNVHTPKATP